MKRAVIVALTTITLLLVSVSGASADSDREEFSVQTSATSVVQGEQRVTPNEKWVFFEGKEVTTAGVGSIESDEYTATLDATLWGKLSPDGTRGFEIADVTVVLTGSAEDTVVCQGTFFVKRYVDERYPDDSPVPYGEAGTFRATCDDGTKVNGTVVGEFGSLGGSPGFIVSLQGIARR